MNKSVKGAAAAAAAGVLLLGGAGSLAYWTATGTVAGGTINSGELTLTDANCDPDNVDPTDNDLPDADSVWMLDDPLTPTVFNPATQKIVPGDTLTKICTYDITASGDHLSADLDVSTPSYGIGNDAVLSAELTVTPTYKVDATVGQATITDADDAEVLEVTVVVTFPEGIGVDNTTQGLSAVLEDITITATQAHTP